MCRIPLLAAARLAPWAFLLTAVVAWPAPATAGCFFPCGIFGLQCRNGGVPPGSVPTSTPVYAPVAYQQPVYQQPVYQQPVYAAPRPACVPCRPAAPACVPCRPAPVCVPVCPPCPRACPSVCPSPCPSPCATFDPCASFDPCGGSGVVVRGGTPVPAAGPTTARYMAGYAPVTAYRRELYSIPQTTYRSVPLYDATAGGNVYYTQPVTTYARRVQMSPYTTYRRVVPNYYGYRPAYAPYAAGYATGGCGSGGCDTSSCASGTCGTSFSAAPAGGCASGTCGTTLSSPSTVMSTPQAAVTGPSIVTPAPSPAAVSEPQIGPATPTPTLLKPPTTYVPPQPSDRRVLEGPAGKKTTPVTDEPNGDGPRLFDPRDRVTSRSMGYDDAWSNGVFRLVAHETSVAVEEVKVAPAAPHVAPATTTDEDEFGGWRPVPRR